MIIIIASSYIYGAFPELQIEIEIDDFEAILLKNIDCDPQLFFSLFDVFNLV